MVKSRLGIALSILLLLPASALHATELITLQDKTTLVGEVRQIKLDTREIILLTTEHGEQTLPFDKIDPATLHRVRLSKLDAKDAAGRIALGDEALAVSLLEEAVKCYSQALDIESDKTDLGKTAREKWNTGMAAQAERDLKEAVAAQTGIEELLNSKDAGVKELKQSQTKLIALNRLVETLFRRYKDTVKAKDIETLKARLKETGKRAKDLEAALKKDLEKDRVRKAVAAIQERRQKMLDETGATQEQADKMIEAGLSAEIQGNFAKALATYKESEKGYDALREQLRAIVDALKLDQTEIDRLNVPSDEKPLDEILQNVEQATRRTEKKLKSLYEQIALTYLNPKVKDFAQAKIYVNRILKLDIHDEAAQALKREIGLQELRDKRVVEDKKDK